MTNFDHKAFLASASQSPGVYEMLSDDKEVLYVGKAKNLKKRLQSYFRDNNPIKTRRLVSRIEDIRTTITHTETEALILEATLIKRLRPKYNVLLRDDKSYPYIRVTSQHDYPRLMLHRGKLKKDEHYFGPFPSGSAAKSSLYHLQKLFRLRSCNNSFFEHRSRPCLQYQIKRCSGPCVDLIDKHDYARDVEHAVLFLQGKNNEVIDVLGKRMQEASDTQDFESAAKFRDQIQDLVATSETQNVAATQNIDCDLVAITKSDRTFCVAVVFMRAGRNIGARTYFPRASKDTSKHDVLSAFLTQYYLFRPAPKLVITEFALDDKPLLEQAMSERYGQSIKFISNVRGPRAKWLKLAKTNAKQALALRHVEQASLSAGWQALGEFAGLDETPKRMECFDVSHTQGEATVASCVVFNEEGPATDEYRKFNIQGVAKGDDYAAMAQVLSRRYSRVKKEGLPVPDILLVDGGKGQLAQAAEVLEELQLNDIMLLGIAKGPERRDGEEDILKYGEKYPLDIPRGSEARKLLQRIRDEAHRFAITGHRGQRAKKRKTSTLEGIPGLGPKRRKALLTHFGGLQGVRRAGVDDLIKVDGISKKLAKSIHAFFHHA